MMKTIRKCTAAMLAALLLMPSLRALPGQAQERAAFGDIDQNGIVDTGDAYMLLAGFSALGAGLPLSWDGVSEENIAHADINYRGIYGDMNGDAAIDTSDAEAVLGYYAEKGATGSAPDWMYYTGQDYLDPEDPNYVLIAPGHVIDLLDIDQETRDLVESGRGESHTNYTVYNHQVDPVKVYRNLSLSKSDIATLEAFAAEHFTPDMTVTDKLYVTHQWIHYNVDYAYDYSLLNDYTFVNAVFNHRLGQCWQYNGAMCAMLIYLGYDAYMIKGWTSPGTQHFWTQVRFGDKNYLVECGNSGKNGDWWQYFFKETAVSETVLGDYSS